jgi:hypothetical protein
MNRDELALTAALTQTNQRITRYIFRVMDEASGMGTTEYTVPLLDVAYALGKHMAEMGTTLQEHAREHGFIALEGTVNELAEESRHKPDVPEF